MNALKQFGDFPVHIYKIDVGTNSFSIEGMIADMFRTSEQ